MTVPLATLATQFLERPGLAASTRKSYELALVPLLQEYGRWSIEILPRQVFIDYLNSLTHLKYTTHQRHQAILQSLLNFAVEQGYLKSNPIFRLKPRQPSQEKGEFFTDEYVRYLTPIQLHILYQVVATDVRLNAIVHLLHRTVHNSFQKLIQPQTELKNIRIHDLRHTFATERVSLMGIEELRALMGHSSIVTTLRYQKVTSSRAEEVARMALDSLKT